MVLAPFIGSWLGVIIRRWPAGQNSIRGRSHCDSCHATLGIADLIPLLSYAWSRGHCRYCNARIGWFPLAIELAALAVAAAALAANSAASPATWIDAALGWALLAAAWIDAETFWLPDLITLPLLLAGLAVTAWQTPDALTAHAAAAAIAYTGFRLLNDAYRRLRHHDGLGAGDAKLLAAAGAWLGFYPLPWLIFIAASLGLATFAITRFSGAKLDLTEKRPFGPALALAFFALRLANNFQ